MAWDMANDRPIYTQLVEIIQMQIVSGSYPPGAKLPTVRELAAAAAVNPNTMQKAFSELERSGLIITQRTNGRNVTEDKGLIHNIRQKLAAEYKEDFFEKMQKLGFSQKDAVEFLKQSYEREKSE